MLETPETKEDGEIDVFVESLRKCGKTGLHNPYKNPERYTQYGAVLHRAASMMEEKNTNEFFIKLIQRTMPKSYVQAKAEVEVTRKFLQNFGGDNCRFLCRSFQVAGDHVGQYSTGHRFPYGPVAIISPFNFPLEIPALQLVGALITGNKVVVKPDWRVSAVLEQFVRLLLEAGMPAADLDLFNAEGAATERLLRKASPRLLQFTGSSTVANHLTQVLNGKIRIEDAGFDWKILGPDVRDVDYVAWVSDQDAYACSGQKCSAQSILFAHENWVNAGIFDKLKSLAQRRKLEDLTLGPILSWNNEKIQKHLEAVLAIPGAKLLFGGKPLTGHSIPSVYGAFQATAVHVPLKSLLDPNHFKVATTELFGPFQVVTTWKDGELDQVIEALERMDHHLTAAVVSNDAQFLNNVLSRTVNGTTYAGIRARTTGAPQNHWFGPAGDPRGAGIGSREAILSVWTCHREVIWDIGPLPNGWTTPPAS
eukprot:TRINITY_DN3946_c0_g1_i4.p1 TRINITY_DN3946_c0_g1~~TRINITY_DN3946_c0_g1_i4.p1  ORF type:complete len:479 (+),score=94.48 TRINITY_DN3946_c0_g1_i4:272-1708(+)